MACSTHAHTGAFVFAGLISCGLLACSGVLDLEESSDVSVAAELVGDTAVLLTVRNDGSNDVMWTLDCGDGLEQRVGNWWLDATPDVCHLLEFVFVQDTIKPGLEHTKPAMLGHPEHWDHGTYRFKLLLSDEDGLLPDDARTSNSLRIESYRGRW